MQPHVNFFLINRFFCYYLTLCTSTGSNDPSKITVQNLTARRDDLSAIADFAHQVALVAAGESRVPPTRSQQPVHLTWQTPATVKQHPGTFDSL